MRCEAHAPDCIDCRSLWSHANEYDDMIESGSENHEALGAVHNRI